jgi:hypothetical protein
MDLWGTERGERRCQRGDDDGAWRHSAPGAAQTSGGGWQWGGTEEPRRRCTCGGVGSGVALGPRAWHARTRGRSEREPVGTGSLYGAGATAMPPRPANPGANKRAPHVSAFPFLEILKNSFPQKKKWIQGEEKSEKISEGRKSDLEHFSSLTLLLILYIF